MKQTLAKQIEALRDMTIAELRDAYEEAFGGKRSFLGAFPRPSFLK